MRLLPIIALALLLGACASPRRSLEESAEEARKGRRWSLVRVELDERYLANAGRQPLFRQPAGTSFGMTPRAFGYFHHARDGKTSSVVRIREPMVGVDGRSRFNEYDLVNFFGRMDESERFAYRPDAIDMGTQPLGVATRLDLEDVRTDVIRVQARTDQRILPYVMFFRRGSSPDRLIQVPYIP